jgi:hypothetical protein
MPSNALTLFIRYVLVFPELRSDCCREVLLLVSMAPSSSVHFANPVVGGEFSAGAIFVYIGETITSWNLFGNIDWHGGQFAGVPH